MARGRAPSVERFVVSTGPRYSHSELRRLPFVVHRSKRKPAGQGCCRVALQPSAAISTFHSPPRERHAEASYATCRR